MCWGRRGGSEKQASDVYWEARVAQARTTSAHLEQALLGGRDSQEGGWEGGHVEGLEVSKGWSSGALHKH